jgi:hypothetical protein
VQSMPITTRVVSLNPAHGEVYYIQLYVIKFVSGFLWVIRFPPPIKRNMVNLLILKISLSESKEQIYTLPTNIYYRYFVYFPFDV